MRSSAHSNGIKPTARRPYVLTVASHKGGTGRTTVALALAWAFGQLGRKVLIADTDPNRSASLIAADVEGQCNWKNVKLINGLPALDRLPPPVDLVVVDCPALTEPAAHQVLRSTDGVLLCCLADTLCLRTLPIAVKALREARRDNPRIALLGLALNLFSPGDPAQVDWMTKIIKIGMPPLLGLPVPVERELRDWPLSPGSAPPSGAGRAAYLELAVSINERLNVDMSAYAFGRN